MFRSVPANKWRTLKQAEPADYLSLSLRLLGRSYCHLCDDMLAALAPFRADHDFSVELVDVDSDDGLEQRYGEKVPVLLLIDESSGASGDEEICHYFLDAGRLLAVLAGARSNAQS